MKNKKLLQRIGIGVFVAIVLIAVGVGVYNTKKQDREVDAVIQQILAESPPQTEKVDSVAKDGMYVLIDFTGYLDGKTFEGGDAKDFKLGIGPKTFIDGFEEQLLNKKAGDKVDVKVRFPKDYQAPNLANKPVVFKVKVKEVHKALPKELNDEFVASLGKSLGYEDLKTVKDLRKFIDAAITQEKKNKGQQEQPQGQQEQPQQPDQGQEAPTGE